MVDFAKAKFATDPTPLTLTVTPQVVGSNTVQLKLGALPTFKITYTSEGSGWEKFNADVLKHAATDIISALTPTLIGYIQTAAQKELNEKASFTVPAIPITVEGISVTLTPQNLNISSADADHALITGTVNIG